MMSITNDLAMKLTDDILKTIDRVTGLIDDRDEKRDVALLVTGVLIGCIADWERTGKTNPPRDRPEMIKLVTPNDYLQATAADALYVIRRVRETKR